MVNNTIPADQIVNIVPSVLGAGGKALDLNGLILTRSPELPTMTPVSFPDANSVADYFGPSSAEARAAGIYFQGPDGATIQPGALLFYRYATSPIAAFVKGGDISALAITDLQQVTGVITVTIDGQTFTSSTIDLSNAVSFSDAATTIQTALGAADAVVTGGISPNTQSAKAQIDGTVLTLSAGATVFLGTVVGGASVLTGTTIIEFLTGTGGAGTYTVDQTQTVARETMTFTTGLMTVSGVTSGVLKVGQQLAGSGVDPTTVIVGNGTGAGGAGTYYVTPSQTVAGGTTISAEPATVTFDSVSGGFVITSGIVGVNSTISAVTGTAATPLFLTAAKGAVLSQGVNQTNPVTTMNQVANLTQNWATFTATSFPSINAMIQFAKWASLSGNRYAFAQFSGDLGPTVTPDVTSAGSQIIAAGYSGTILNYAISGEGLNTAARVLSYAASLDFSATNGRATLAFRSFSGAVPSVTDAATAANLIANGYNYIGAYATANQPFTFYYPGQITGPYLWADSYFNQIWLNNQLQLALVSLLTTVKSIPYNSSGNALIRAACSDPINAAINYGAIRQGVTLSAAQALEVKVAAGIDISAPLQTAGYYLQILDATPQVRAQRGSPPITLWYMDGESVQSINMASILIQ